eukprot:g4510.t1
MPSADDQGAVERRAKPRLVLDGGRPGSKVETKNPLESLLGRSSEGAPAAGDDDGDTVAVPRPKGGRGSKKGSLRSASRAPQGKLKKVVHRAPLVSKMVLVISNVVFMCFSLAIIALAGALLDSAYKPFFSVEAVSLCVATGTVLLVTSFLGLKGALSGKAKFLVPYALLLSISLVLQIIGAALVLDAERVVAEAESRGFQNHELSARTDAVLRNVRGEIGHAFQVGNCTAALGIGSDAAASKRGVTCQHPDGQWIANFVNGRCERDGAHAKSSACMQEYNVELPDASGLAAYCMCRAKTVAFFSKYAHEIGIVAAVVGCFQLFLLVCACHALCRRKKLYQFHRPKETVGEPYSADGKTYLGAFPLLYGNCVGFRQLAFFLAVFVPVLVVVPLALQRLLPVPSTATLVTDGARPITIDADHCSVLLEQDHTGKRVGAGKVELQFEFADPRAITSDPDTWISVCGRTLQTDDVGGRLPCRYEADYATLLRAGKVSPQYGCTNYTAHRLGAHNRSDPHICILNTANKAFVSTAYAQWKCVVRVIAGKGTRLPPLTIRSTERQMAAALDRVSFTDVEVDTSDRAWSNARYHFCQDRLKLSSLTVEAPDARLELDCFDMTGPLVLRDTDQSQFHIFSDDLARTGGWNVDVELRKGDVYFWDQAPVRLLYNDSSAPQSMTSLCTVAEQVFDACQDSGSRVLSPTATVSKGLADLGAASGQAACGPNLLAQLPGALVPAYTTLTVTNHIAKAVAAQLAGMPEPLNASAAVGSGVNGSRAPAPRDVQHNHVQVETGVFVDTVYDSGKTFVRNQATKSFTAAARPAVAVRNRKRVISVKPSFSGVDIARLRALFHYDDATMPTEDVVTLDILAEGIPLGTFTWYKNIVYSFIAPEVLSFISMDLLNPTSTTMRLELVDNFCPIPYLQNLEAEKEVLNAVYESLYEALEPLPKFNVFTFVQLNRTYQGAVNEAGGAFATATEYVFQRDDSSPKLYRLITKEQAIKDSVIFQFLISINIVLTLLSAFLFSYFVVRLLSIKRLSLLRELVATYRADLGGLGYLRLEAEIKQKEAQSKSEGKKMEYQIVVRTGKKVGAGTEGRIYVTLIGHHVMTREIELVDSPSMGSRNLFQAGAISRFTVSAADVGAVCVVRVRHEMSLSGLNASPSWFLDGITIFTDRMVQSKKPPYLDVREEYTFPCGRWLAKSKESNGVDEGLVQELESKGGKKDSRGLFATLMTSNPLSGLGKKRKSAQDNDEDEDEEERHETVLDEAHRRELIRIVAGQLEARSSPFWLVDALICVKRHQDRVKETGGKDIPPAEVEETVKMFKTKLMNKYLSVWNEKVEEARADIQRRWRGMKSTLELDENGDRVIDPKTGDSVGDTVIRQGLHKGYRVKTVLLSDLPAEEKEKRKLAKTREMEVNFALFDTSGTGDLDAAELRVCLLANGMKFGLRECKDIISDMDVEKTNTMTLGEYKELVRLKERELPENHEAVLCFKAFMDPTKNTITFDTLKRALADMGEDRDARGIQELVDRCDLDNTGDVTLDDFLTVLGCPTDRAAVEQKIAAIPIPSLGNVGERTGLFGPSPDKATFRHIVQRYWPSYRMMTDEAERTRFLKLAAFASRPGNFLDKLPSAAFLLRCGLTERRAKAVLRRVREGMLLDAFYAYFNLSQGDKKRFLHLVLRRREQYFAMGVTKRAWFVRQSLADCEYFLNKQHRATRAGRVHAFFSQLWAEFSAALFHAVLVLAPPLPIMCASLLYDVNFKKYHPNSDQSKYEPLFLATIVICAVYLACATIYLLYYYLVKAVPSREGRESTLEKLFRKVYYAMLFITGFFFVVVVVCCLYWIVLGTVLKPSDLVPVFAAVAVVGVFAISLRAAMSKFRRVCHNHFDDYEVKLRKQKKEAIRFKLAVTRKKAEMMAECERAGQPFTHAGKLQKIEDHTRASIVHCNRIGSAGTAFLVAKGLTQADILIAVFGSVTVLVLLVAFIFAGVKAFTEPGSEVAATINTGLTTVAGAGSNGNAKKGLSPDVLERCKEEVRIA